MNTRLQLDISRQPDDFTCGPTCLHAVYRYFSDNLTLDEVISGVPTLEHGGTLGVLLGCHALRRGYRARIYTYNLQVFDPTWFVTAAASVRTKLEAQVQFKPEPKLRAATEAYVEYLNLGGELRLEDLSPRLIRRLLGRDRPVLAGLSATFLYRTAREFGPKDDYDDIRGQPAGHFVVICGYDREARKVLVADPLQPNPLSETTTYALDLYRLINAILLGTLTYDANLLVLEPPEPRRRKVG
jgi:hypothetical protein